MCSLEPSSDVPRSSLFKGSEVVNIPHRILTKLTNEDSVWKSVQVNVVVIRGSDDELVFSKLLAFHHLDAVDYWLMCYDEPFNLYVICGVIFTELEILEVPQLQTTWGVSRH